MPKVKICCISSLAEAEIAIAYGATAIGLVGNMPSGPGVIEDDLIKEIANATPFPTETFLLTSETTAEHIIAHHKRVNTTTIQMVDKVDITELIKIKLALPKVSIIQVIHVMDETAISEAIKISRWVDGILLDSGNPNLAIKKLGGTGKTHNWEISRQIVAAVDKPIYLAGGLNANNVAQAMETVHPYCVDVCNGVRTDGSLDEQKLAAFFSAINKHQLKA